MHHPYACLILLRLVKRFARVYVYRPIYVYMRTFRASWVPMRKYLILRLLRWFYKGDNEVLAYFRKNLQKHDFWHICPICMIFMDFPTCVPESNDKPLRAHTSLDKPLLPRYCLIYALICPKLALFS